MASPAAVLNILVTANTKGAQAQLVAMNKQLATTEVAANKAAKRIGLIGKVAAVGIGAGLAYSVKKAADFEEQMDSLGSVTGASAKQMERFKKQAMEAGAATKFSALDAAEAQTELAKGGLRVQQIMRGGLKSALALAAAGEIELAEAAETTVNAMKLFGLRGKDAMKVADGLATAANATTSDVGDFALALKQGGAAAKIAGLDFQGAVTILEALAEAGVRGADAGTSMKAFFLNIATPSEKAKKAMKELGVSIFDAQGNLKSLPAISENLRKAFGDLTQEQFLNKAGTIAGSDAIRTLYALYDSGPEKLGKLQRGLEKEGTAADVARKKQSNLKGALENLQGSVETIAIGIGTKLVPELTKFARQVTKILNAKDLEGGEKFNRILDLIIKQIEAALPKVADAGVKVAGALASAFARAWINLNPLAKLFTLGVLLRVIGGRGAILAAGGALGKMFGAAFGTGAAAAVGPGAKNAGAKGGTAFLGGFKGILGKIGVAGLVAALFGPEIIKAIDDAGTHADAAGAEFEFASERMRKLQKAGNMGGLIRAARDAQYTAKQMGAAGAPLKALADRMELVGDASKRLRERLERMRNEGARSTKELAQRVQYNTGVIADVMGKNSRRGKEAMGRNFAAAAQNVRLMMKAGTVSVKEGTKLIEQYMVKALQTMGFSKKEALMVRKGQDPYTGKAIDGNQNLTNKQRGGPIQTGAASGDSVPAMLERGEYVLNRNAVSKVGRQNLDRVNFQGAPRFQGGGWVGDSPAGLNPAVKSMALWAMGKYGAQASDTLRAPGTLTSSGNVSDHTTGAAVDLVSGNMLAMAKGLEQAFGPKIKQLIHTPLGYSINYGERVGAFAQEDHYDHVHLAALGKAIKGVVVDAVAPKLNNIQLDGPDSMLKSVAQGALNATTAGAQATLNAAARATASQDAALHGNVGTFALGAGGTARQIWDFMIDRGFNAAQAAGWLGVFQKESGFSTTVTNPSSGATGLAQWLGGRLTALKSKPNWSSLQTQLNFVWEELNGAEAAAYAAIKGATSPESAASVIDSAYERSDAILGATGYARSWFERFAGGRQKGGPVGYAGDSLGQGTAPLLKGILKQAVWSNSAQGRGSPAGVPVLKGFDKASQLVFDLGTNDPNAKVTHSSLLAASRTAGKRPLHFLTLLGGPDQAGKNKMFRAAAGPAAHEYLTDYAAKYKGGHDDIGHPSSYGSRARMLAETIKRAQKATTKPNKPGAKGKLNKRKHLSGLQAPSIKALNNAVEGMRYGKTEEARTNALHRILDLVRGTSLPKGLTDKVEGLTEQSTILGDYADRAGQLTTEDAAGNVFPGNIGGKTEVDFLTDQLGVLAVLRNRLVEAQEKLAARRKQIRELLETAQKHFDYYQKAVVAWGHVIRVQEKKLEELRKKPKKNKKQIEATRNLIMALKPEQAKTVATRDALKGKIIPALKGKHGTLGDSRSTMLDSLAEVQGVGSPLTQMATLPALGSLGGSIFDVQMRLRELKLPPESLTDTAADTLTSDRDDLLKEIGRLTLQRTAVERMHEITLKDFPDFDRLGIPFGGKFHTGGIVPGPVGTETATVLQGGEGVFTRDQMAAMGTPSVTINVAPGMEWLKQFITVEVDRSNRMTARNAGRGLPGRGGGNLG